MYLWLLYVISCKQHALNTHTRMYAHKHRPVYLVLRQSAIIGYHVLGLPITVKENYIPLTILGIFYFSEEQMVFPNVPPQIIRTDGMYCGYQRPRYLITKDGDSSSLSLILQKDNGTITISHTGHVQVTSFATTICTLILADETFMDLGFYLSFSDFCVFIFTDGHVLPLHKNLI